MKKAKTIAKQSEAQLHRQVCDYLRAQYPNVLFTSEASGLRLTMGQAVQMKRLRSGNGFPDLMIFEPRGSYHGLFIELKAEGTRLTKKDGTWATEHLVDQGNVICDLAGLGYFAEFCIGFDEAKRIIDSYLRLQVRILPCSLNDHH
jgi:hypothetical protein